MKAFFDTNNVTTKVKYLRHVKISKTDVNEANSRVTSSLSLLVLKKRDV